MHDKTVEWKVKKRFEKKKGCGKTSTTRHGHLAQDAKKGTLFEPFFFFKKKKKPSVRKKSLIYIFFFDKKNLGEPETNLKSMGTS